MAAVEIEIDNPKGHGLHFLPLSRSLRARFDFRRINADESRALEAEFPNGIPAQRLRVDPVRKTAEVIDPLADAEHEGTRRKIEGRVNRRLDFGKAREPVALADGDVPTYLYWLRRAVESGLARLVEGDLPGDEQCKGARKRFHSPDPEDAPAVRLQKMQLAATLAIMTAAQRKEYERILADLG